MALHWDISKVEDWEVLHEQDGESAITDALIWATIYIGIPSITQFNVDEWVNRIAVHQEAFGPIMSKVGDDGLEKYYITHAHIERRIGLSTNASKISIASFKTNVYKHLMENGKRRLTKQEIAEAVDA